MSTISPDALSASASLEPDIDPTDEEVLDCARSLRSRLVAEGYYPVAIGNNEKWPTGQTGWQVPSELCPALTPDLDHLNTGIHTRGSRAIDIDCDDPADAVAVGTLAVRMLGVGAPVRYRQGASRLLFLYRSAEADPPKKLKITGAGHSKDANFSRAVEVLGDGQQVFVHGVHPEAWVPVEWQDDFGPGCGTPCRFVDLPAVTEAQVIAFLDAAAAVIQAEGPTARRQREERAWEEYRANCSVGQQHAPLTLEDIESALGAIPYENYDQWVRLCAACKAANPASFDVFAAWMKRQKRDYDDKKVRERWSHPLDRVGPGTLIATAKLHKADWMSPSMMRQVYPDAYAEASVESPPAQAKAASTSTSTAAAPPQQSKPRLRATALRADLAVRLPLPRSWLYGKSLIAGHTSVLGAYGGAGKTTLATAIAMSVAIGRALLDPHGTDAAHRVHVRRNVWYFNLEDAVEEMERRVLAAAIQHGVRPKDWEGRLFLDSGRDQELVIAKPDRAGGVQRTPQVDELVAELLLREIGLLVVDPMVHSHDLDENSNPEMAAAMKAWNLVAERARCAVLLVHHFRKGGEAGSMDAFRGGSAIGGAARVMETCRTMTQDEAEKFGVPQEERRFYMRWDDAKGSMAPAGETRWFRLIGVRLGNSSPEYPDGDTAQTLVPATFSVTAPTLNEEQVRWVLSSMHHAPEPYTTSRQSPARWMGRLLVDVLKGNGFEVGAERAAAEIIKDWLAKGWIVEDTYTNKHGMQRNCVRVSAVGISIVEACVPEHEEAERE